MTKKLYDLDSHRRDFTAAVLRCDADGERYVVLDQTLFFPEGGGQPADTGVLGSARVLDVQITQEAIVHYTDAPLTPGAQVRGEIDWPQRFRRMQGHSGETRSRWTITASSRGRSSCTSSSLPTKPCIATYRSARSTRLRSGLRR